MPADSPGQFAVPSDPSLSITYLLPTGRLTKSTGRATESPAPLAAGFHGSSHRAQPRRASRRRRRVAAGRVRQLPRAVAGPNANHKLRDGRPAARSRPDQWSQAAEEYTGGTFSATVFLLLFEVERGEFVLIRTPVANVELFRLQAHCFLGVRTRLKGLPSSENPDFASCETLRSCLCRRVPTSAFAITPSIFTSAGVCAPRMVLPSSGASSAALLSTRSMTVSLPMT